MQSYVSAQTAIEAIKSGDRLYLHSVAAAPQVLIRELVAQAPRLRNVEIVHLHTEGEAPYAAPEFKDNFSVNCLFIGANMRQAVQEGRAQYTPVFLSDIPKLFREKILAIDVALIQVSPPDIHGYCSLGVTVEAAHAALHTAGIVIAQVNERMPRTHGDALVHASKITYLVEGNAAIPEGHTKPITEIELMIGKHVAGLVADGATIQTGIGSIPDAVLKQLHSHKDLGVHTEMFSDGMVELVERGVVNGSRKAKHMNKIVATFVMGSQRVYDFVHDNPMVAMLDVGYVNNPSVIGRNPRVTAINSAIEVDVTGQVCADSIGTLPYSGVGGQIDFVRGAALSEGGKSIIALASRTKNGTSKIASVLKPGAGVVTTRAHVRYIVTEYGIAELFGKSLLKRAEALIRIAHPEDRDRLIQETRAIWNLGVNV
ncbi:MAG: 4-hydroxybutyrate CoA-transferase [Ignavibacteria bacterium]|nr:4-hydroxybutyrate CoA-transferase [Ignavibacteria bacterium]